MKLEGKKAVVTGAGRGIGKGIAIEYAKEGADMVISDILEDELRQTEKEVKALGRACYCVPADITNTQQVNKIVDTCVEEFGRIDILAHASGVIVAYKLAEMPEDVWDRVIDINLKGTFLITKAAVNYMIPNNYGKIVLLDSCASKTGEPYNSVYSASKAGIKLMAQVLSLEVAENNINVNTIAPGTIDTEMIREVINNRCHLHGMTPQEFEDMFNEMTPLKRMGTPEEVGKLAVFLASDDSAFITGTSVNIAGGREVH